MDEIVVKLVPENIITRVSIHAFVLGKSTEEPGV